MSLTASAGPLRKTARPLRVATASRNERAKIVRRPAGQLAFQAVAFGTGKAIQVRGHVAALGGGEHPLDARFGRVGGSGRRCRGRRLSSAVPQDAAQDQQRDQSRDNPFHGGASRMILKSSGVPEPIINLARSLGSNSAIVSKYRRRAVKSGERWYSANSFSNRSVSPCASRNRRSWSASTSVHDPLLVGLSLGQRAVGVTAGQIDLAVALPQGVDDVVERLGHFRRRLDAAHVHGTNRDSHFVPCHDLLQLLAEQDAQLALAERQDAIDRLAGEHGGQGGLRGVGDQRIDGGGPQQVLRGIGDRVVNRGPDPHQVAVAGQPLGDAGPDRFACRD